MPYSTTTQRRLVGTVVGRIVVSARELARHFSVR